MITYVPGSSTGSRSPGSGQTSWAPPRLQAGGPGRAASPGLARRALALLATMLLRLVPALALAAVLWGLWLTLQDAPQRQRASLIRVDLAPGAGVVLGRHELAAPQAAERHLHVFREADGRWRLRNLATSHGAEVRLPAFDRELRSAQLQAGSVFRLGAAVFRVMASDRVLEFQRDGDERVWTFDGALLRLGQGGMPAEALPPCVQSRAGARLRGLWNAWVPQALSLPTRVVLGGVAQCGQQIAVGELPADSVWIERRAGQFWLRATHESARRVCVGGVQPRGPCAPGDSLFESAIDVSEASHLWVGRSRYAVRLTPDQGALELRPQGRTGWLSSSLGGSAAATGLPVGVQRMGVEPYDAWRTPHGLTPAEWMPQQAAGMGAAAASPLWLPGLAVLGSALALGLWARWRSWGLSWPAALAMGLGVGMAGLACIGFALDERVGEAWRLALLSSACVAVVLMPGRTGWAWLALAAMAGMGLVGALLQIQLGIQGQDSGAWSYFNKTTSLLSAALWSLWAWGWWLVGVSRGAGRWAWPSQARLEAWIMLPVVAALLALGLQVLVGSEEGVAGFQPVELAKLALVVLAAHALAMRLEWSHHRGVRRWTLWLRFLAPAALFIAIVGLALGLLNDYSPLVLVGVWLMASLLAWAVAAGSRVALLLFAAGAVLSLGLLQWVSTPEGLGWLQAHGFYPDRFQVLVDLPHHPHSGDQVHRALQLASQGGAQGQPGVAAWRVPAIQDDMLPALLLGRYGYLAGVLLWCLQLVYLFSVAALGWQALRQAGPGDHRRRWLLRLGFFAAWGATGLWAGHLMLSWGTVTSALPVMGQPQPLVSAGGSIIVLFVAPLHALWLAIAATLDEASRATKAASAAADNGARPISGNN